jgi:hypothetical protein
MPSVEGEILSAPPFALPEPALGMSRPDYFIERAGKTAGGSVLPIFAKIPAETGREC